MDGILTLPRSPDCPDGEARFFWHPAGRPRADDRDIGNDAPFVLSSGVSFFEAW
jgi:hypothetical protein